MDKNVAERSFVTGTAELSESHDQHQVLEYGRVYSTVDDAPLQTFVVSGNPAYNIGFKHSQYPVQQDDHAYVNVRSHKPC